LPDTALVLTRQDIVPVLVQVGCRQDIVPVGWVVTAWTSFRSSQGAGKVVVAVVDDLAVDGDDDEFLGSDLDDRGDVLVGLVLGDEDAFAEQVDTAVRSDVADYLDSALGGEPRGWLVGG